MPTQDQVKEQLREQAELARQPEGGGAPRTIRQLLEDPRQQAEIAKALPNAMTPDRLARLVLTAVNSTPLLQQCDALTLLAAGMQCAALGLEPNTPLQHCWLLPFKNTSKGTHDVQFVLGYQGMVDLALRSPRVKSVTARPVYAADDWECDFGADLLRHVPELEQSPGDVRFYYGIAHLTEGGRIYEPAPLWLIDEHRQQSKAPNSPAWKQHFDAMARKTCIRILWRWLPKTAVAAKAIELDESTPQYDDWFGDNAAPPIDVDARDDVAPADVEAERCAECGDTDGAHQEDCSLAPAKK